MRKTINKNRHRRKKKTTFAEKYMKQQNLGSYNYLDNNKKTRYMC